MGKKRNDPVIIPPDVKSAGSSAMLKYVQMVNYGVSPSMAEILACKKAPAGRFGPYGAIKPGVGPTIEGDRIIKSLDNPG